MRIKAAEHIVPGDIIVEGGRETRVRRVHELGVRYGGGRFIVVNNSDRYEPLAEVCVK